jgi:PAS domain S-box-containing protein
MNRGNVNEWNFKTAEITGFTREEAMNRPLVSLLEPSIKSVMDKALKGEETSNYAVEFKNRENETKHILLNATSRRDEHHKIVGVLGVGQVSYTSLVGLHIELHHIDFHWLKLTNTGIFFLLIVSFHRIAGHPKLQDVTEVTKHDREVAAMANELRQLVNTANAPIFGIDIK